MYSLNAAVWWANTDIVISVFSKAILASVAIFSLEPLDLIEPTKRSLPTAAVVCLTAAAYAKLYCIVSSNCFELFLIKSQY